MKGLWLLLLMMLCGGVRGSAQRHYGVNEGLPNNQTRQVVCLPDGRLLVQTDGALSVFDGARFRPIELDRRLRQPIENFFCIDHYLDPAGRLWVKGMSDLYVLDAQTLTLLNARRLLSGVKAGVRNVFVTADGVVWAHAWDDRLYRCHEGDTTAVLTIDSRNVEGINAVVCDVVQMGERHLVFTSDGRMQDTGGQRAEQLIEQQRGHLLRAAALSDKHLLARTADGVKVVGGKSFGIGSVFDMRRVSPGKALATTSSAAYIITADSAILLHEGRELQGAALDKYGGLWLCTFNSGLLYYTPYREAGQWTAPQAEPGLNAVHGEARSYQDARIRIGDKEYNADNTLGLWGNVPFCIEVQAGTYLTSVRMNRLALFRPPQLELLTDAFPQLLRYRNLVDACRVGHLIVVASQNGIYAFNCRTLRPEPDHFAAWNENQWSDKVNCLLPQGDSIVWVGTSGGVFRLRGQEYERVSAENAQSLVFDTRGRLWMSTIDGRIMQGGRTIAKTNAVFRERKAQRLPDGSLEFLAASKAYVLHPDSIHLPQLSLTPHLMSPKPTAATYDASALTADVSALAYGVEEQVAYRYRLVGAEEEWHTAERTDGCLHIAYNVVPPGEHTLQVQAAIQGMPWGETLELPYRVAPPWWRTWWAYALYLTMAALAVALSLRSYLRIQRAHLENERKEARIRALLRQIEEASRREPSAEANVPVKPDPEVITLSPLDEEFMAKAKLCAEKHLSESEYSVEQFSSDMAMDRSTLYRHLKDCVGQSPLEFLRTVRLRQAAVLLKQGRYSIAEVSDMTGFANRRAFAKYFKAAYGVLPSGY